MIYASVSDNLMVLQAIKQSKECMPSDWTTPLHSPSEKYVQAVLLPSMLPRPLWNAEGIAGNGVETKKHITR
jgi:hypothetical protein